MLPVGRIQVGCVGVATGALGVVGVAFRLMFVTAEEHPAAFFAITVWEDPPANPP